MFSFSQEHVQELQRKWGWQNSSPTEFAATVVEMVAEEQEELFYDASKDLRLAAMIGALCTEYWRDTSVTGLEEFIRGFPPSLQELVEL